MGGGAEGEKQPSVMLPCAGPWGYKSQAIQMEVCFRLAQDSLSIAGRLKGVMGA